MAKLSNWQDQEIRHLKKEEVEILSIMTGVIVIFFLAGLFLL